jgi:hypothetical protein
MTDPIIGRVPFVNGAERDLHQAPDGRQYVLGYDSERVFGVWLLTGVAEAGRPTAVDDTWTRYVAGLSPDLTSRCGAVRSRAGLLRTHRGSAGMALRGDASGPIVG